MSVQINIVTPEKLQYYDNLLKDFIIGRDGTIEDLISIIPDGEQDNIVNAINALKANYDEVLQAKNNINTELTNIEEDINKYKLHIAKIEGITSENISAWNTRFTQNNTKYNTSISSLTNDDEGTTIYVIFQAAQNSIVNIVNGTDYIVGYIKIPKDSFVNGGEVVTGSFENNAFSSTGEDIFLKLTLANTDGTEIYINIDEICDSFEFDDDVNAEVLFDKDEDTEVVVASLNQIDGSKIVDGAITEDNLDDSLKGKLDDGEEAYEALPEIEDRIEALNELHKDDMTVKEEIDEELSKLVTTTERGLMSKEDKGKLDDIHNNLLTAYIDGDEVIVTDELDVYSLFGLTENDDNDPTPTKMNLTSTIFSDNIKYPGDEYYVGQGDDIRSYIRLDEFRLENVNGVDYDGYSVVSEYAYKITPNETGAEKLLRYISDYENKNITLAQFTSEYPVGTVIPIGNVDYQIIGINHDELANKVNNEYHKALVTLQSVDCIEVRPMNDSNTNSGGWESTAIHSYCNGDLKYNLENVLGTGVLKQVTKKSANGGSQSGTKVVEANDYVFLLSEQEVFSGQTYSYDGEGTQYAFYANGGSKIKKNGSFNTYWWLRSAAIGDTTSFCRVDAGGLVGSDYASFAYSISPVFCLGVGEEVPAKPFSYYATHLDELGAVLDAHYAGEIDLSTVWSIGDTMENIPLSAINATNLGGDGQSAQNIDLVILDFNHDTLSSDTTKKAAITLGQKDSLSTSGKFYSIYNSYAYARYTNSPRRGWLNSYYKSALPSELQSLIKSVNKVTGYPTNSDNSQTTETTSEDCWLASNYEVFGSNFQGFTVQDGTQYPYYSTQNNRIKKLGKTGSNSAWWTRSGFWRSSNSARFVYCISTGYQNDEWGSRSYGLVPHFCL
mgnify:CR=1 FL=1